jgi:hypothetical protein
VRGANGKAMIWRHTDPERFEALHVRTEAFNHLPRHQQRRRRGERIVVHGSELINQVR